MSIFCHPTQAIDCIKVLAVQDPSPCCGVYSLVNLMTILSPRNMHLRTIIARSTASRPSTIQTAQTHSRSINHNIHPMLHFPVFSSDALSRLSVRLDGGGGSTSLNLIVPLGSPMLASTSTLNSCRERAFSYPRHVSVIALEPLFIDLHSSRARLFPLRIFFCTLSRVPAVPLFDVGDGDGEILLTGWFGEIILC